MSFTRLIFRLFFLCIEAICAAEWEKRPIKKSLSGSDESITATPSWLAVWHKARREQRRVFWLDFIQTSRSNLAAYCSWCWFIVSVLHLMKKNELIKKSLAMCVKHKRMSTASRHRQLFYLCSFCCCLWQWKGKESRIGVRGLSPFLHK